MWMDGHSSRKGITADLEAMHRAGLGGVILMEVDVGIPKGPVKFMSAEWRRNFKHAVQEAERLGLQMTLNAGPGWTGSGGPWVKPEQSMQFLVASAVEVVGPTNFRATLPQPAPRPPYFGTGGLPPELLQAQNEFYREVAVLAFPTPAGEARIADLDQKALYVRDPFSSMPGVKPFIPMTADDTTQPDPAAIAPETILDLTDQLEARGQLTWTVPPGRWTVMRFGRTSTGANTRPAPAAGLGLESDKFDPAALDAHFAHFIGALQRELGPDQRRDAGWTSLHIDSWEMGAQNWTAAFRAEFQNRRGYDPLRFLPAYAGYLVTSRTITERFLWDVRQTAQELVLAHHAEHLKTLAHQLGLGLSIEPYDMNPTADLNLGAVADVPMGEFWAGGFATWFSCFEAASIAHTGGKTIVAAESFTSDDKERWRLHPGNLKGLGDWAFGAGVNRMVFHRYAHQPWLDRWPGMTMGPYGVHWERTQTWWDLVGDYHRYLARCQVLLRRGVAVADILYLTPEGAPQVFRPPQSAVVENPPDRREYNFDACSPETLMRATVKHGRITFTNGTSYRVLTLPCVDMMTPRLLARVKALVTAGATVYGRPPRQSPSLTDYPRCDAEVRELAAELWGAPGTRERRLGQGRVVRGAAPASRQPAHTFPGEALQTAKWIWCEEGRPATAAPVGKRHFRRAVSLPGHQITAARISVAADNEFTLWLNGHELGTGSNFHQVQQYDVTPLLKPETNWIAVLVRNGGDAPNPAGLIAALQVRFADGTHWETVSDATWQAAIHVGDGWPTNRAAPAGWSAAMELGLFGMPPWGRPTPVAEPLEVYPDYAELAALLRGDRVPPDFESDGPLRYAHRRDGETEIYFVANRRNEACTATAAFRVQDRIPELWNPLTGDIQAAQFWEQRDGRTFVPLPFEPYTSWFVLFRKPGRPPGREVPHHNRADIHPVLELAGPWRVQFQAQRGAPDHLTFTGLVDWSRHDDAGVRHFSGVATYRTSFKADRKPHSSRRSWYLDLGQVEVMARVNLNGHDLGTVWTHPFRVDVTDALQSGDNHLVIEVANLWPNRLIGDAALPKEQQVAWTTWNPFAPDTPLLTSGLLGPVRLLTSTTALR